MHSFLNWVSQAVRAVPLLAVAIVMGSGLAQAHELTPAVADLSFGGDKFELEIEMNLEAAMAKIGPEHDDSDDSPNKAQYEALRALEGDVLGARFEAFFQEFLTDVYINIDGQIAEVELKSADIMGVGDVELARISTVVLEGPLPAGAQTLTFAWADLFGPIVLRTQTDVENEGYSAFLAGGEVSEPIVIAGQKTRSLWAVFISGFLLLALFGAYWFMKRKTL